MEVGDIILCTVDRIVGTTVFVKIDGTSIEGSIVMSEIAPGRIRNLRDYVVPKKKIVCKVLRISESGNIDLSLRRVTPKEKKEAIEKSESEKSYTSILKSILGADAEKIIKEILEENDLPSFLEEAKTNPEKLEKLVGKENSKKILDVLKTQKKKRATIKKEIHMTTTKPDGITLIKKVLEIFKGINVKYLSAGKYTLELESEDIKIADKKIRVMTDSAEKEAKKLGIEFSVK
ncbi:Translation initiation factor 2 subunit alpha [uncultured archaeon]|nr:Translation initiation factor 2 subunit alpha [uncultured archaeon]